MGKILFVLKLPEPKLRKVHAPPSKRHKDVKKYSRRQKHKAMRGEAPGNSGASFLGLWFSSKNEIVFPVIPLHFLRPARA